MWYYFGIVIALTSSAIDVFTYFIIRKIGTRVPSSLFPFVSGSTIAIVLAVYMSFFEPAIYMTPLQKEAITLAFIGTFFGWIALEMMIIGLRMSKSALASYGEQCGVTVTFTFDAVYFGREFLKTDWIAISLILSL